MLLKITHTIPLILVLWLSVSLIGISRAEKIPETHTRVARLFVLSGQSNMVGLNPANSFIPFLKSAFPDDEIVVVRDAENGQPLRRWYAREEPRDLYDRLLGQIKPALREEGFASVTFIWMQGEADATWAEDSDRYDAHMRGLIQQLRNDLKQPEMSVVIGRISSHFSGTSHGDKVRQIQVDVAESDPLVEWIDTDDLPRAPDGVHFSKEGYLMLGQRFAQKAIELIRSPAQ